MNKKEDKVYMITIGTLFVTLLLIAIIVLKTEPNYDAMTIPIVEVEVILP